ncbi:hypothetical protein NDU88_002487 [Pleurodeles waltl]|uniref:Uncharacterized protein n=1 Tax=Pleurodeles waltl TaxID=8319 RepID=A0AAV7RAE6_PLEWA|nr:hypothetical protein NDU88_002487 [Pleurodeles waltl]
MDAESEIGLATRREDCHGREAVSGGGRGCGRGWKGGRITDLLVDRATSGPPSPTLESPSNRAHRAEGPAALERRFGLSWNLGLIAVSFEGMVTAIYPGAEYRLSLGRLRVARGKGCQN